MGLDEKSDGELVELCLGGDPSAWAAIVQRYRRLVYSVPSRMRLRGEEADDVFQETFVALLEKLHTVKDRERVGLWLAVTARRKALDRVSRGPAVHEVGMPEGMDPKDPVDLADDELVRLERQAQVRRALAGMDGRCRTLLEALYYEDPPPPYKELSRRLKVPEGSLGPTRMRCFEKLRRLLDAAAAGNPRAGKVPAAGARGRIGSARGRVPRSGGE